MSGLRVDADPEDLEADMGAVVYARSSALVEAPKEEDLLLESIILPITGVKAPQIPAYAPVSNGKQPGVSSNTSEPATPKLSDSTSSLALANSIPSLKAESTTSLIESTPKLVPRLSIPRKIPLSNLPMSNPGAGPGPRTMENSPRLAQLPNISNSRKMTGHGFHSPGLSRSGLGGGFPSTGLGGFPSPSLGKSSLGGGFPSLGLGLGLTHRSAFSSVQGLQVLALGMGPARTQGIAALGQLPLSVAREGMGPGAEGLRLGADVLRLGWASRSQTVGISRDERFLIMHGKEEGGFEMYWVGLGLG